MAPASISDAARQRQFVTCTGPPAAPLPAPGDGAAWARPRWSQWGTSGLAAPTGDSSWSRMGCSAPKSAEPSWQRDSSKIPGSDEDLAPALPGGEEKCAGAGGVHWSDFRSSARHWDFVKPRQFASSWWCDQEAGPVSPPAVCPRHPGLPEHRASTALLPRVPPGVGSPSTRPVGQLQRSLVLNPDSLGCWRSAIIPKLLPLAGHSSGHSSGDPVGCQCPREDALHQGRWRMSQNVVLGARSDPIASPEQGRGIAQRVRTSPVYSGLGGARSPLPTRLRAAWAPPLLPQAARASLPTGYRGSQDIELDETHVKPCTKVGEADGDGAAVGTPRQVWGPRATCAEEEPRGSTARAGDGPGAAGPLLGTPKFPPPAPPSPSPRYLPECLVQQKEKQKRGMERQGLQERQIPYRRHNYCRALRYPAPQKANQPHTRGTQAKKPLNLPSGEGFNLGIISNRAIICLVFHLLFFSPLKSDFADGTSRLFLPVPNKKSV